MTRIGCRAHDYGKLPAAELAATLRAKGYNAAQLAMPRAIAGIEDFSKKLRKTPATPAISRLTSALATA